MKRIINKVWDWFSKADTAELERHLEQSVSIEDIERRLREWDSRYHDSSRLR